MNIRNEKVNSYMWYCNELQREIIAMTPVSAIQKLLNTSQTYYTDRNKRITRFKIYEYKDNANWFYIYDSKRNKHYNLKKRNKLEQPHFIG